MITHLKKHLEKWILATALFGIAAVAYVMVMDPFSANPTFQKTMAVGKLTSHVNDVRRRSDSELSWSQIPNQDKVFNRDHIFTGENSKAEIDLDSGVSLSMNANSMIVIGNEQSNSVLNLKLGGFFGRIKKQFHLKIQHDGKDLDLKSSDSDTQVEVHQAPAGELNITVVTGHINVEKQGQIVEIKENQVVVVTKDIITEAKPAEPEIMAAAPPPPVVEQPVIVEAPPIIEQPEIKQVKIEPIYKAPKRMPAQVEVVEPVVQPPPPPPVTAVEITEPKKLAKQFWFWLGSGMSFQSYEQSIPSIAGNVKYQNINGPSVVMRSGFQGENWGVDLTYRDAPGQVQSSDNLNVLGGKYRWKTLGGEVLYKTSSESLTNYRLGIQHHSVPFMFLNTSTANVEIKSNVINMATLGVEQTYNITPSLKFEWLARYQLPVSSSASDGANFKITPKIAFDGSVGGIYQLTEHLRLGTYWYAQWHDYNFSYAPTNQSPLDGRQSLFISNFEIRLGFDF